MTDDLPMLRDDDCNDDLRTHRSTSTPRSSAARSPSGTAKNPSSDSYLSETNDENAKYSTNTTESAAPEDEVSPQWQRTMELATTQLEALLRSLGQMEQKVELLSSMKKSAEEKNDRKEAELIRLRRAGETNRTTIQVSYEPFVT